MDNSKEISKDLLNKLILPEELMKMACCLHKKEDGTSAVVPLNETTRKFKCTICGATFKLHEDDLDTINMHIVQIVSILDSMKALVPKGSEYDNLLVTLSIIARGLRNIPLIYKDILTRPEYKDTASDLRDKIDEIETGGLLSRLNFLAKNSVYGISNSPKIRKVQKDGES